MHRKNLLLIVAPALMLAALFLAACGGSDDEEAVPIQPTAPAADQGQTLDITAVGRAFTKSELEVPANQTFTIRFDNQDDAIGHNFAIYRTSAAEELIAATQVRAGPNVQELTVEGGLPPGEYFFRCDPHREIMTGTLIVR